MSRPPVASSRRCLPTSAFLEEQGFAAPTEYGRSLFGSHCGEGTLQLLAQMPANDARTSP